MPLTNPKQLPIMIDPEITGFKEEFYSTDLKRTNLEDTSDQFLKDYLRAPGCTIDGHVLDDKEIERISQLDYSKRKSELESYLRLKKISDTTIDFLISKHDQYEFGIFACYLKPTFEPLGYAAGKLLPKSTTFTYQNQPTTSAQSAARVVLTTELGNFGGMQKQSSGDVSDFIEKKSIFGGKDILQTVNTYEPSKGKFNLVSREIRTNSPALAADIVLGYLTRSEDEKNEKKLTILPSDRDQMILYIAKHPRFPMEVKGIIPKEKVLEIIREYYLKESLNALIDDLCKSISNTDKINKLGKIRMENDGEKSIDEIRKLFSCVFDISLSKTSPGLFQLGVIFQRIGMITMNHPFLVGGVGKESVSRLSSPRSESDTGERLIELLNNDPKYAELSRCLISPDQRSIDGDDLRKFIASNQPTQLRPS